VRASTCRPVWTQRNPAGPADAPARPDLDLVDHCLFPGHAGDVPVRAASIAAARGQHTRRHSDQRTDPRAVTHPNRQFTHPDADHAPTDSDAADTEQRAKPHLDAHRHVTHTRSLEPRHDVPVTGELRHPTWAAVLNAGLCRKHAALDGCHKGGMVALGLVGVGAGEIT
jgi:hypothetical protein